MRVGIWKDILVGVRDLGHFAFVVMFLYVKSLVGIVDIDMI